MHRRRRKVRKDRVKHRGGWIPSASHGAKRPVASDTLDRDLLLPNKIVQGDLKQPPAGAAGPVFRLVLDIELEVTHRGDFGPDEILLLPLVLQNVHGGTGRLNLRFAIN